MSPASVCFFAGLAAAVWNVVLTIMIGDRLQRRHVKVNWLLLRLKAPAYVQQYGQLWRAETGRRGSLYVQWILSINLALVAMVVAFGLSR